MLAATEAFVPAMALVDCRIADWRIGLVDTVLFRDGVQVAAGRSDLVLGDPTIAVAWLANALAAAGSTLRAGQVVLPGSGIRPVDVRPGESYRGEFTALGPISVAFD